VQRRSAVRTQPAGLDKCLVVAACLLGLLAHRFKTAMTVASNVDKLSAVLDMLCSPPISNTHMAPRQSLHAWTARICMGGMLLHEKFRSLES
jgi:hypothetical protein